MTNTPTEMQIPDDVMEAAEKALLEIHSVYWDDFEEVRETIARAILQERERCARIAESVGNYGDYKREELTKDYGQPRFDLMNDIVSAIRHYVDK